MDTHPLNTDSRDRVVAARGEMYHKQENYYQLLKEREPVVSSFMPRHVMQNTKTSCYKETAHASLVFPI